MTMENGSPRENQNPEIDDAEEAAAETPPEAEAPETEGLDAGEVDVEALLAENADTKDKLLRALAEVENVRRRAERDKTETAKFAITSFARDLLAVGDNLRRALDSLPEEVRNDDNISNFLTGIEMTEKELLNAYEKHGIEAVNPMGEKFDHNYHQAMFEVESPDAAPGTVVQVVQTGYVLNGRLLRPAMVGVAKKPAGGDGGGQQGTGGSGGNIDTSA